jgi:hypothetical protein
MSIHTLIAEIRAELVQAFSKTDAWFEEEARVRNFRPANGGWTIDEVLEHISITNHFLLILIEKGAQKAMRKAQTESIEEALKTYVFHRDKLTEVGIHQSFPWIRPEHMEPKGERSTAEVRALLHDQLAKCLSILEQLKNGEGILYKTTMTVNELGKIDVYEYLCFLAQHGERHITQMIKNKNAFADKKNEQLS